MKSCFREDLFAGKNVIVSGGTSGIGLQIALGFLDLGADVIALGSDSGKIALLRYAQPNPRMTLVALDVRDANKVRNFCSAQTKVDVLINCAGFAKPNKEWEESTFLDVVDVNLFGQMRLVFGLIGCLRERKGSIINVASMLSFLGDGYVPGYSAAKSGVLGFTRSLAHKFGRDGVRVNAIAPGYHMTELTASLLMDEKGSAAVARRTALGRYGTTEDLVGAVIFLSSPAADYITGVCLPVDGGYLSGNPLVDE